MRQQQHSGSPQKLKQRRRNVTVTVNGTGTGNRDVPDDSSSSLSRSSSTSNHPTTIIPMMQDLSTLSDDRNTYGNGSGNGNGNGNGQSTQTNTHLHTIPATAQTAHPQNTQTNANAHDSASKNTFKTKIQTRYYNSLVMPWAWTFPWCRMAFIFTYFVVLFLLLHTCGMASVLEDQLYGYGVGVTGVGVVTSQTHHSNSSQKNQNQLQNHTSQPLRNTTPPLAKGKEIMNNIDDDLIDTYGKNSHSDSLVHVEIVTILNYFLLDAFSAANISSLSDVYDAPVAEEEVEEESTNTSASRILQDLGTPQGKAFHWLLHHDKYTQRLFSRRHRRRWESHRKFSKKKGYNTDMDDDHYHEEEETTTSMNIPASTLEIILQRYILTVFFFATGGEYNTNFGRQFTPSSNVGVKWTAHGALGFLSEKGVCRWNTKIRVPASKSIDQDIAFFDDIISNDHDHNPAKRRLGLRKLKKEKVGIVCDEAGKVVEMHLRHMGISGPISAELGLLQSLERLKLRGNYLTGTIPNSIGGVYAHNHAHAAIDGEDQKKFVLNEALEFLDLAGNLLVGPIPDTLGSLPRLESLLLHSNRIHGEKIHSSICQRFNSESFNGDGEDDDADRGTGDFKSGLWADCGQKFDAIQCDCCSYCCNSSLTNCIPNNG